MKRYPVIAGVALLAALWLAMGCNNTANKNTPAVSSMPMAQGAAVPSKIAYVNIDSLEEHYELLKQKRADFRARQEQMQNELQKSFDAMNAEAEEVQKKAQARNLSEVEAEAAQKHLGQMQRTLETRKQTLTEQLLKEQEDFNKDLKARLDAFLEEYNKTRQFDYVLSYSYSGSSLLYVNKQLDITKDVVDGMNARAREEMDKKKK